MNERGDIDGSSRVGLSSRYNELPKGWIWTTVAAIGEVTLGRQRSPKDHEGTHMRPYLRVANVYEDEIDITDVKKMNFTPEEFERFQLKHGDLLLNEGQSKELVGRPAIFRGEVPDVCFQNTLVRFRCGPCVLPSYALTVFRCYLHTGEFRRIASWTTNIAHLGAQRFATMEFPLPPLEEQRRIVFVTDSYLARLDDAIRTLERVGRSLKRYRASVLKSAVEGRLVPTEAELAKQEKRDYEPASVLLERILAERRRRWSESGKKGKYQEPTPPDTSNLPQLPEGWCWASLEALTSAVRPICYGILMPKDHIPDGIPYVKVRDMRSGRLLLSSLQRTTHEIAAKFPRSVLHAGDLLLSIRGTYGRVVVVPPDLEGGNITQDSARLDCLPGVNSRYLKYLLLAPSVQKYFKRVARGVAVKGVNISDVRITPIALPPLSEQAAIADFVEDNLSLSESSLATALAASLRAKGLRRAILRWAFEGNLVDQDSGDEAANILLARTTANRGTSPAKSESSRNRIQPKSVRSPRKEGVSLPSHSPVHEGSVHSRGFRT